MSKTAIQVDHIARIEGHGNIHVVINDGVVESVEMQVSEPARFFESMVKGRDYSELSYIVSRICGICSASHVVTNIKALEKIFAVEVSDRTKALRELLIYGSYLQNHATHLFVFSAPDFVGTNSVFPLSDSDPELFQKALGLKSLGNELCTKVGGRSIHPIAAVVGGFTHEISRADYLELAQKLEDAIPFAVETVDLFNSFELPDFETQGDMLAMIEEGYYPIERSDTARFLEAGISFDAKEVNDNIEEYSVGYSAAYFARVKATKSPYMTSALARINASWGNLSSNAKVAAAKAALRPPVKNPMRNNEAQAIELVDALERCAGICRKLASGDVTETSLPVDFQIKAGRGVGYTEAPRGALFHDIEVDDQGKVLHASIMTPTAQNLSNLESDVYALAKVLTSKGSTEKQIREEIEKLVRAYDPCLSCSVH